MGYAGGGVNGALRWKDLALDLLLPVDEAREEAEKAVAARKIASGAAHPVHAPTPSVAQAAQQQAAQNAQTTPDDGGGEDEDEEEEDAEEDEDAPEDEEEEQEGSGEEE